MTSRFLPVLLVLVSSANAADTHESQETVLFAPGTAEVPDPHGVRQYRIPHITTGPRGETVVSAAGRTNVAGDNGHTTSAFAVSRDGGKTWEHIRFTSDYEKPTPKGEFPMASRTNEVQVEWFPALGEYVALYCHHYKCYLIRSKNLKQWGDPVLIPHQDRLKKAWPAPTSMRVEDGELAFNLIVIPEDKPSDERSVKMFWTRDGETFEASQPAPFPAGEANAVYVGEGKYLHVARTRQRKLTRLTFTYDRRAKQWSECRSLPVPTYYRCEQDLLAHEGTLYLSAPLGPRRRNGCIYVSRDKGVSWKVHHKIPEAIHFGYSSITILPSGELGLAVERQADPKALRNVVYRTIPAYCASSR